MHCFTLLLISAAIAAPVGSVDMDIKPWHQGPASAEDSFLLAAEDDVTQMNVKPIVSISQNQNSVPFYYPTNIMKSIKMKETTAKDFTSRQLGLKFLEPPTQSNADNTAILQRFKPNMLKK
jgi:hypothetical protein